MSLIIKIAFRNILRHRGISLVIGTILFIGALFMSLGNGVINGAEKGIKKNLIDRFSGSITVMSARNKEDKVLGNMGQLQVIGNYKKVDKVLENQDYINKFLPLTRGVVLFLNLSMGIDDPSIAGVYGVDFEKYQNMFQNNIVILEGVPLKPGEKGILLNVERRTAIYHMQNIWLFPEGHPLDKKWLTPAALANIDSLRTRNDVVLLGINDIRLPVKGVFKFRQLNTFLKKINIINLESLRECFAYVTSADKQMELPKEYKDLLEMEEENLFDFFSEHSTTEVSDMESSAINFESIKKEASVVKKMLDLDEGAYNLVFVKLKKGISIDRAVNNLNSAFRSAKIDSDVRAVSWKDSFGILAEFILFFRITLSLIVNFIYFVAIVVIVNTLSMAAIERTYEIGMMRAVGAQKGFIGTMFFTEISLLSFLFGGLGMISGIVIVSITAAAKIPAHSQMMSMIFGGDTFHPILDSSSIVIGIIQLVIVTLIAMIYPLVLSRRITPLDAINRD